MPDERALPSHPAAIPADSLVFGYLPMLPFIMGALGCWFLPSLRGAAIALTVIWGAMIITFVGGVRRGFGFGNPRASLRSELWAMAVYFTIGGMALILGWNGLVTHAIALLTVGFAILAILDHRAARTGNAPAHFAALRPFQMPIATLSLLAILARLVMTP